ncbi:MAG: ATPase [Prevotella sp.]|nr:ATPase [Prevotella sp.]
MIENPFILKAYENEELFCDREREVELLQEEITNGNNIALIAQRRIGKTGLIYYLFNQPRIKEEYNTIIVDIYATKNIEEFTYVFSKAVLSSLRGKGATAIQKFIDIVMSLKQGIAFDSFGNPSWSIELGDIHSPQTTIDEVFHYLENADRPCIVAIDEFQTVATYPGKSAEAMLRTYIQKCHNTHFIFSGSQQTMMQEMFMKKKRPFYQSTAIQGLGLIDRQKYAQFAMKMFGNYSREIDEEVVYKVYDMFEGITWYLQRVMNKLFTLTPPNEKCDLGKIDFAIDRILEESELIYESLLFQLPPKQKELLVAICKEGKARNITSKAFCHSHGITASSVQAAIKGLLEKNFVIFSRDYYEAYDKFFSIWLQKKY